MAKEANTASARTPPRKEPVSDTGTIYVLGDEVAIYSTTFDSSGQGVTANVDVYVRDPNNNIVSSGTSTELSPGFFKYSFDLATTSPSGTYSVEIDADYNGDETHESLTFLALFSQGGLPLNISNSVGSFYRASDTVAILSTTYDATGTPVNANVDVYVYDPSDVLVSSGSSTLIDTGSLRHSFELSSTAATGTYRVKIDAFFNGNEAHDNLSFIVDARTWTVILSDVGEVLAGDTYITKAWVFNFENNPVDAITTPTVNIWDPSNNQVVTNGAMTKVSTGVYEYTFAVSSSAEAGTWETEALVEVEPGKVIGQSDFWEVEGSPAQVIINSIIDNTVPTITADVRITNEGTADYEYQYEWCIVDTQDNQCNGGDDIAHSMAAKLIDAGENFDTNLTLNVPTPGTYYFKVVVYWGTEKSTASLQFNAVAEEEEEEPTPPPPSPGGGGGPPPPPTAEPTCRGADFNLDNIVDSTDFSIMLFFWKTNPPFTNPCVDINRDSSVNSVDFSILLFQWGSDGINFTGIEPVRPSIREHFVNNVNVSRNKLWHNVS